MSRIANRLASLCLLVVITTLLIACGGGDNPPAEEEVAVPTQAPAVAAAQPTTVPANSAGEPAAATATSAPEPTDVPAAAEPTTAPVPTEAPQPTEAPAAPSLPAIDVPSGITLYSNANSNRDITIFNGRAWVATEGGVVAYDAAGDYSVYTTQDGLPHSAAFAITVCPTPEETLIVSTPEGLATYIAESDEWAWNEALNLIGNDYSIYRMTCDAANNRLITDYDDVTFLDLETLTPTSYSTESGLVDSYSTPEFAVSNGTVYVVFEGDGISAIAPDGTITNYTQELGNLPTNQVNNVAVAPDGGVWVGSQAGLIRLDSDSLAATPDSNFGYFGPSEMAFTADGMLWLDYSGGLCAWDVAAGQCASVVKYNDTPGMTSGTGGIKGLTADDAGNLAYYTSYDGSSLWNGSEWQKLMVPNQPPVVLVQSIMSDAEGTLWVSGDGGVYTTTATAEAWNVIPNIAASEMVMTDEGMWFVGYYNVYYRKDGEISQYRRGETEGILNTSINTIGVDEQGRVYIGQEKGFTLWDNGTFTPITTEQGWTMGNIRDFLTDGDGVLAATTEGLVRISGTEVEVILNQENIIGTEMPSRNIAALARMSDGTLLLGTTNGLVYFDATNPAPDPGVSVSITDVAVTPDDKIWLTAYSSGDGFMGLGATGVDDGGIYHYDGNDWQRWGPLDGMPGFSLRAVAVDGYGIVWAGGGDSGEGNGLVRLVP